MDNFSTGFIKKEIGGTALSKSKDKIRVTVIGGNAVEVTGSCTLIEWGKPKRSILMECGLLQGLKSLLEEYRANNANFKFKPKNIDYVFVSDLHQDHCGLLPKLVKQGFSGKIFVPNGFSDIFKVMALDSAGIMARNAMDLSKKFQKFFEPIFTESDVYDTLALLEECPFDTKIKIDDDIEVEFLQASHTVCSSSTVFWIKNGNVTRKIGFTGDLGNVIMPKIFVNNFEPISSANLLLSESTYSDAKRSCKAEERDKDMEKIKSIIYQYTIDSNGKVLFPTFSFMRTQQILSILYNLFYQDENFTTPIYLCSPLACKICDIFDFLLTGEDLKLWKMVRGWSSIHYIRDFESLEATLQKHNKDGTSAIFLASSPFMVGGFAPYLVTKLLPSAKNMICFVGYGGGPDSLSARIRSKKTKTVNIQGKPVPNRANVQNLKSFSSHIQHDELLKYLKSGYGQSGYDKIALVHGDFNDKVKFAEELKKELEKQGKSTKVIAVNKGTEILL